MKYISHRITNIIHTDEGILQGFVIRYLVVRFVFRNSPKSFKIPLKIINYNKKHAKAINNLINQHKELK